MMSLNFFMVVRESLVLIINNDIDCNLVWVVIEDEYVKKFLNFSWKLFGYNEIGSLKIFFDIFWGEVELMGK